ncbi:hypothetical protein AZH90_004325 [Salmonella enterica subsp. enterica serovar Legon]|nr:hypothetical protein [Salmonella enterica subsp. enterica serovar Derby]EDS6807056.1 hypothetical protein [Salmonella enterica subsp. enterica serovar Legon]EDW9825389.1 hypothetical protein [Salmonella enterica]EDZ3589441.1 hypothetical protein [Salmonella enterica subsp. enterica serovar Wagenia]
MKIRIWLNRSISAYSSFHGENGSVHFRQFIGDGFVKMVSLDEAQEALALELQCNSWDLELEVLDEQA